MFRSVKAMLSVIEQKGGWRSEQELFPLLKLQHLIHQAAPTRDLRGTVFLNPHPPAPADFLSEIVKNVHKYSESD